MEKIDFHQIQWYLTLYKVCAALCYHNFYCMCFCMFEVKIESTIKHRNCSCNHSFSVECVFDVSEPHSCNPQNSFWTSLTNFVTSISMIYTSLDRELNSALNGLTIICDDAWCSTCVVMVGKSETHSHQTLLLHHGLDLMKFRFLAHHVQFHEDFQWNR